MLNSRLSEYVRIAASGETVLVTDRDRVVAEMGPPDQARSPLVADALMADLVRNGLLKPPLLTHADPPPALPVAPLADVLRDVDQERSDR